MFRMTNPQESGWLLHQTSNREIIGLSSLNRQIVQPSNPPVLKSLNHQTTKSLSLALWPASNAFGFSSVLLCYFRLIVSVP